MKNHRCSVGLVAVAYLLPLLVSCGNLASDSGGDQGYAENLGSDSESEHGYSENPGSDPWDKPGPGDDYCPGNECGSGCDPCGLWAVCIEGACVDVGWEPQPQGQYPDAGYGGYPQDSYAVHDMASDPGHSTACTPDCTGKICGDDGCGGVCGWCGSGQSCQANGQCGAGCAPDCAGKMCGSDGCGGSCGWCDTNQSCQGGQCITVGDCEPDCVGKDPGEADGCGGLCSGSGTGIGLVPGGAQDVSYFRLLVSQGQVPEPDEFPIEGLFNEKGTPLPDPELDKTLTLHAFLGMLYEPDDGQPTVALQLGMNSGISPEEIEASQFNLALVIDKSGSMGNENKLADVKKGLKLLVDMLNDNDYLSIIVYDNLAEVLLEPTLVTDKQAIKDLIGSIQSGGSTNLYHGMVLGYDAVFENIDGQHINRIMLLSDGMTNQGVTDIDMILAKSKEYNDMGVGTTTIGVGTSFNFDLMHLLATQGGGNFYFVDGQEKLEEVFHEDVKYLLTPVADDLRITFTLAGGFGVDEVYGFEYKEEEGTVTLLNPSPMKTFGGQVIPPPVVDPTEPDVAVPTIFASKKNGVLMIRIQSPDPNVFQSLSSLEFAEISYSYVLVKTGEKESHQKVVEFPGIQDSGEGAFQYYQNPIVRRNTLLLYGALAIKEALVLHHEDNDSAKAVVVLDHVQLHLDDENASEPDNDISDVIGLIKALKGNLP